MEELEVLLDRRWVLKSADKELYYKIRDAVGEIRKFASEKLGCQLIENSLLVKLEKIPAIPEPSMGILEFTSREEYAFLCILLMFLEDRDAQEQFILSQLTEYVASNMPGGTVDWTLYTNRRRLIKVLRYAVSQGLIQITDGDDDEFMGGQEGEVLYENTGASRYFMRNFSKDIMGYSSPEDFQESEWFEVDEDRGLARRQRVYKRILFSVGMYREIDSEEDFEYLKYYGRRLAEDLERNFDCQVHIHRGSAFFLAGESCRMGMQFPGNNVISDIILLCCADIRKKVEQKVWTVLPNETILADRIEFEKLIRGVKARHGGGFTKNYREMPDGEFVQEVMRSMEQWSLIHRREREHQVAIYASAGKLQGHYPENFAGENSGSEEK
ncbi:MAG: TIGR02678 family protein [Clostridiaceae bacterium]|nr:TIGR02678 family protein [Clostridiaceae bacterium]